MENKWSALSINIRWPHQGIMLGFHIFDETIEEQYSTVHLHLLFITIIYEWGIGEHPY